MTPGRELDALVAEKVMGWKRAGMKWEDQNGKDTGWFLTEHGSQECDPFSPSTDISPALQVVEKVGNVKMEFLDDGRGYWCEFRGRGEVHAPTAPHAICLAALKACGVENITENGD